jgi:hypothetical protein
MLLGPLVGGGIVAACNTPPETPPPAADTDAEVHLGSGATGAGGEASVSACVAAQGQCMDPGDGNICPLMIGLSCSTGSDTDANATFTALICCTDFNDAGAPDDVQSN